MKTKTSITLSSDLLAEVDRNAGSTRSRSAYIERALRDHLRNEARRAANERDLALINAAADRMNKDAEELLDYQAFGEYGDAAR